MQQMRRSHRLARENQLTTEVPERGRLASWPLVVQMSQQERKPTQALFLLLFSLRERCRPFTGLSSGSGGMLLFAHSGGRLVLGGGQRGGGGAETQPPERDSHSGSTGEKRTPHHHNPSGIPGALLFCVLIINSSLPPPPPPTRRQALAGCCTTCCPWFRFEAGPLWPKAGWPPTTSGMGKSQRRMSYRASTCCPAAPRWVVVSTGSGGWRSHAVRCDSYLFFCLINVTFPPVCF